MSENIYKRLDEQEKEIEALKESLSSDKNISKLQKEISEMRLFLEKTLEYQPRRIIHRIK